MTLYIKMNRHLRMMLQHGLFHLHIIVIVVLEKVVEAEVVVKTNEKVVAEVDMFNEKVVAEVVIRMNEMLVAKAEVVVRMNEMLVAEAEVINEKVVVKAVLLIKTKKKEVVEVVKIID